VLILATHYYFGRAARQILGFGGRRDLIRRLNEEIAA